MVGARNGRRMDEDPVGPYGGASQCGGSNRAAGRETYRGYSEQCGAEREADGMQYRNLVQ